MGAYFSEMLAPAEGLRWERGEALRQSYEAPLLDEPPPYRRTFCSCCGSPLPVPLEGTEFMVLLAGVLDDDPGTQPFRRIFVGESAAWDRIGDELPRFDKSPPRDQRL